MNVLGPAKPVKSDNQINRVISHPIARKRIARYEY